MKVETAKSYSISKIVGNNVVFSKEGCIAYMFLLEQPEKYQLSEERFDNRINEFFTAFYNLPQKTYIHKQDVYLKNPFDSTKIEGNMFLDDAMRKHFSKREGMHHYCVLSFVISDLKSLEKSYLKNPFSYKESLIIEDKTRLISFDNTLDKAIQIIGNMYKTKLIPMNEDQVVTHIKNYVNGFELEGLYDIDFSNKELGDSYFDVFSFSESEHFPKNMSNVTIDRNISREEIIVKEGIMDNIGETFPYNHIYNQIIYFEGSKVIQNQLDLAKDEYGKLRKMSTKVDEKYMQLEKFLEDAQKPESDKIFVKSHSNIILFEKTKEGLEIAKGELKSRLGQHDIKDYNVPKKEVLKDIFLGSIIGRENKLHEDNFYISHLKQALFLWTHTTLPRHDQEGVFFNDRVYNLPLKKDIWDEKGIRIKARNGIVVANTGGGKSVTALNIITQFLSKGVNVVVAEFGMSFKFMTLLYPDISKHIKYDATMPLGINPFRLYQEGLSIQKLDLITSIILKTWRVKENFSDPHVLVSITKIIKYYYSSVRDNHSYESFYQFVVALTNQDFQKLDIDEKYFDLGSFRHVCSDFITGGKYENVFKVDEATTEIIKNKQFVVFELTEVKKDPFLVTLILLILQETIDTNILSDRSKKGALFFDEFAESSELRDLYSGEEVLHSVAIMYQKIRKENGAVWTIIQNPSQLPENNYTKSIRENSQILVVLPSKKSTYLEIQDIFKLEKYQTELMQTLKNNTGEGVKHKYSELFIRMGEESFVLRLELSKQAFLAFQTEGEIWSKLNTLQNETESLQKAIELTLKN